MARPAEPAIKSYYFGKGYVDLLATIRSAWELNTKSAKEYQGKANAAQNKAWPVLWWAAAIAVVVFGTAFFVVASVVHVVVLLAFFGLIYVGFSVVYLAERTYLLVKRYRSVCPHCSEKLDLPHYYCDKCAVVHKRLIPSNYGILHRICQCGQKLPATFFTDRGRLQATCQKCSGMLHRGHVESRKLFIPVIGGPSVGKSAFLYSAIWQFVEDELPSRGCTSKFLESRDESSYSAVTDQLKRGRVPNKTTTALPSAFNISVQGPTGQRVFYLYDPAGEAFETAGALADHKYYGFSSGCIFLIDPFSLPEVRQSYSAQLREMEAAVKPGPSAVDDTLNRMVLSLEENFGLSKTGRAVFPLAVVVSKTDAFGLGKEIGASPAAADGSSEDPVRAWLRKRGQSGLVQKLEARFTKVGYFSCSALGRVPDQSEKGFLPSQVLDPVRWILSEADSSFFPLNVRRLARASAR
jgi:hypothetical protein